MAIFDSKLLVYQRVFLWIAILWISLIFRHTHSEYICICMYCIDSTCQASILSRKLSPILVLLLQLVQTDLNWAVTNHIVAALGIVQNGISKGTLFSSPSLFELPF